MLSPYVSPEEELAKLLRVNRVVVTGVDVRSKFAELAGASSEVLQRVEQGNIQLDDLPNLVRLVAGLNVSKGVMDRLCTLATRVCMRQALRAAPNWEN